MFLAEGIKGNKWHLRVIQHLGGSANARNNLLKREKKGAGRALGRLRESESGRRSVGVGRGGCGRTEGRQLRQNSLGRGTQKAKDYLRHPGAALASASTRKAEGVANAAAGRWLTCVCPRFSGASPVRLGTELSLLLPGQGKAIPAPGMSGISQTGQGRWFLVETKL